MGDAAHTLTREIFGNQPPPARAVFYMLALGSTLVFCWGVWRRVRLWLRGRRGQSRPDGRVVIRRLARDVLGQRRVRGRGAASVAHILLFSGFMVLLLATTLLGVEHALGVLLGRDEHNPVFHKGIYFAVYELISDAFGVALIAGCVMFAWRRGRGRASIARHWTDWAVLGALLGLGITGYLVEGLRILREQTPQAWLSFVGYAAARTMQSFGVNQATSGPVHFVIWWVHAVAALAFVAALPYTRLLHAIAGSVRLAFGASDVGKMSFVSVEEVEATGTVGAGRIEEFTRLQLIEMDACVSCGRCQDACPAFEAGKPLSPRDVVQDLRGLLDEEAQRLLAQQANDRPEAAAIFDGRVREETVWSCTTCGACTDVCPLGVHPLGMITDMRRHLVGEGKLRGAPAAALQKMDRSGNPWGLPAADRMAWADGLNVPTVQECPDFEVLYWVGCAAAYDKRLQDVARSVVRLLRAAKVRFAILGDVERCTGESARRMGDEFLFQQLAARNIQTLSAGGAGEAARTIVAHCPHCVNSLLRDYPQMGGRFSVKHHSEYFFELAAAGRLPRVDDAKPGVASLTYHDPCYLARARGETFAPRALLAQTLEHDESFIEMPRHGRQTACCGAGGGRMWFDDKADERVGGTRVDEALATGAQTVAVACPFCHVMLSDGVAARGAAVQVRDIAEIYLERLSD